MAELEAPWSVARDKATHTDMSDESVAPDAATQTAQPRCGGGSRQVLLGWDSFRSRVLLALLVATVVWAAVYFPLISLA